MTDKTDSKEREAPDDGQLVVIYKQANGEDVGKAQPLTTKRIINAMRAAFQAGRASLAASAGSEPVAWTGGEEWEQLAWHLCAEEHGEDACDEVIWEGGPIPEPWGARWMKYESDAKRMIELVRRFYTHPSPPGGMVGEWIALPGALPEPGTPVLLDIGKKYPIRAMWAAKHTVEAADDDTDWGEYDEATETYYCPEGWYEWNEHEDTNWAVSATPRAWTPLPPTNPAGSGKGE